MDLIEFYFTYVPLMDYHLLLRAVSLVMLPSLTPVLIAVPTSRHGWIFFHETIVFPQLGGNICLQKVSIDIHTCLEDALPPAPEDAVTLEHRIGNAFLPLLTQLWGLRLSLEILFFSHDSECHTNTTLMALLSLLDLLNKSLMLLLKPKSIILKQLNHPDAASHWPTLSWWRKQG